MASNDHELIFSNPFMEFRPNVSCVGKWLWYVGFGSSICNFEVDSKKLKTL